MPGVDESDDAEPGPGASAQGSGEPATIASGSHDQNTTVDGAAQVLRPAGAGQLEGIIHDVHRSIGVGLGAFGSEAQAPTDPDGLH